MGKDGLEGSRLIHDLGGRILAQDEASSVVWGMPGYVVREGLAEQVDDPENLGDALRRFFAGRGGRK